MTLTYHNNFCSFDINSHPSETVIDCRFLNIQRQIFHTYLLQQFTKMWNLRSRLSFPLTTLKQKHRNNVHANNKCFNSSSLKNSIVIPLYK